MKGFFILILLFSSFHIHAQVNKENIKGTWVLCALSKSDTNLVIFFKSDSVLHSNLKHFDTSRIFKNPQNIGWNHDFNMYKGQYMTFKNTSYSCGFATDSTYSKTLGFFKGEFKINPRKSTIEMSIFTLRFKDKLILIENETIFNAKFLNEYLVLDRTISGVTIYYYLKNISSDILLSE